MTQEVNKGFRMWCILWNRPGWKGGVLLDGVLPHLSLPPHSRPGHRSQCGRNRNPTPPPRHWERQKESTASLTRQGGKKSAPRPGAPCMLPPVLKGQTPGRAGARSPQSLGPRPSGRGQRRERKAGRQTRALSPAGPRWAPLSSQGAVEGTGLPGREQHVYWVRLLYWV